MAAAYRSLAGFAAALPGDLPSPVPEAAPFQEAWAALVEARALGWRDEHAGLAHALHQAEGLRAELAGLARAGDRSRLEGLARALRDVLSGVADRVQRGQDVLVDEAALLAALDRLADVVGLGKPKDGDEKRSG